MSLLEAALALHVGSFLKSTGLPFLHGCKNSMRNDHDYADPDYTWDANIHS